MGVEHRVVVEDERLKIRQTAHLRRQSLQLVVAQVDNHQIRQVDENLITRKPKEDRVNLIRGDRNRWHRVQLLIALQCPRQRENIGAIKLGLEISFVLSLGMYHTLNFQLTDYSTDSLCQIFVSYA